MDINQRIKSIVDVVFDGNVSKMAAVLDIRRTSIQSIIKEGGSMPGFDIIRKIAEKSPLPINLTWLLTGEGKMIKDEQLPSLMGEQVRDSDPDLVPEIPIDAIAGSTDDMDRTVSPYEYNMRPRIPGLPSYDMTVIVRGDSMAPTFESGDRLAVRRCFDIIEWGAPHVIDTEEGAYIKRIKEEQDRIVCISDNPEYQRFFVDKRKIRRVFRVVALLRIC